ncbi:hypothetical protein PISMIDRAFT_490370 [Pisolithus microcarpus 441]|uniref:Uncharacterized protein n=1 Tax=Pisolithus microcarpus 441 TaxID=765257 RepID=A0A0C9YX06_9AGAM|nr:hypothetical protein PISMIDRAFT_490370 [Pisolithus microcarpus 441]
MSPGRFNLCLVYQDPSRIFSTPFVEDDVTGLHDAAGCTMYAGVCLSVLCKAKPKTRRCDTLGLFPVKASYGVIFSSNACVGRRFIMWAACRIASPQYLFGRPASLSMDRAHSTRASNSFEVYSPPPSLRRKFGWPPVSASAREKYSLVRGSTSSFVLINFTTRW